MIRTDLCCIKVKKNRFESLDYGNVNKTGNSKQMSVLLVNIGNVKHHYAAKHILKMSY